MREIQANAKYKITATAIPIIGPKTAMRSRWRALLLYIRAVSISLSFEATIDYRNCR